MSNTKILARLKQIEVDCVGIRKEINALRAQVQPAHYLGANGTQGGDVTISAFQMGAEVIPAVKADPVEPTTPDLVPEPAPNPWRRWERGPCVK